MLEEPKLKAASALKLPKDVVLGEVLVSCIGKHALLIENYRNIIIYTDTQIKLQTKTCRLIITGSRLNIEYYTSDEMKVQGLIKAIEFEG